MNQETQNLPQMLRSMQQELLDKIDEMRNEFKLELVQLNENLEMLNDKIFKIEQKVTKNGNDADDHF